MRHDPASAAIVIMLRSLKMYGMAQAVSDLMEQGSPAFEAAVPILSQLLKAETAEREVRSIAYQIKAARFPAYKDLAGFDFAASEINEALVRQLHRGEFMDGADNVVLIGGPEPARPMSPPRSAFRPSNITAKGFAFSPPSNSSMRSRQEKAQGKAGQIAERLVRSRPRDPRRARLSAVQRVRRSLALPPAQQALRAHQRRHHHQPQLQRMGRGVRRRQDDDGSARSPHPPLPHPRNRKRQLPLQGQRRHRKRAKGEGQCLDQNMTPGT